MYKRKEIILVLTVLVLCTLKVEAVPIGTSIEYFGPGRTVGIDKIDPDTANAKLDVNEQILIRGGFSGTPAAGLVLTSLNSDGLAGWSGLQVDSSNVVDNSLTASDIATNAIGLLELGLNSVNSSKIVDGSITAADLAPGVGSGLWTDIGSQTYLTDTADTVLKRQVA